MAKLTVAHESWPIEGHFTIARGRSTETELVVVEITDGGHKGRGECHPFGRYNETPASVLAQIEELRPRIEAGLTREDLQTQVPSGAARNALDCAFWDLESQKAKTPVAKLAGIPEAPEIVTAFTISLGTPEEMAAQAKRESHRPLLKLKLGGEGDDERVAAAREAAPNCRLIVDANESWSLDHLRRYPAALAKHGVELIEQPLPAGEDGTLAQIDCPLPICADEAFSNLASLPKVKDLYDAINIKLDKTGGLTEALRIAKAAREADLKLFVGCMVSTSLSIAPARLVAGLADWVDLDGALLLARDRDPGLVYREGRIQPVPPGLWGYCDHATPSAETARL